MPLVNMKSKPETEEMPGEIEADEPRYPYGLCIHIGKEEMEKLGIDALPKVGTQMRINAVSFVKGTSAYETQGAGQDMHIDIQITDMEIVADQEERNKDNAQSMYGKTNNGTGGSQGETTRINGIANALYGGSN